MDMRSGSSGFLCTLPGEGKGITYHVAVCFIDAQRPTGVLFTSFVGAGRRAFAVLAEADALPDQLAASGEALCRLAIGQVVRDHLHDKAREGDYVLDLGAAPWDGELRPVGSGVRTGRPHVRVVG
ncbi:hypothetical protein [Cupriavidus oxalaticus]|uniref:Uncharacterized protein n=1 Tax=Cupriavidus oxalaticus TaxID=96344 RepID=A0A375GPI8_9BURK|nr:hypothetical protein [Cupriavidus oxalaticus]QEZ45089.1 hypothetical protein D2917_04300 [Cupriavidus oxalaticus]QRQ85075.1 hypothetical protein JTE91_03035 [Cupriavidus oxalaticus]QRQ90837.1 hypothetical protein JTE92_09310 [Cupriavidus oxalaticus]WQD85366.1 hypothetical protein U0036_27435 [Cupriavidus oxalaticus]SPC23256.1 conserved hypothetical protein [Cupriavidus oxalaticus]